MNVYNGSIHNHQKLKTTYMSLKWQIDEHSVSHSYNGILCNNKNDIQPHGLISNVFAKKKNQTQKDYINIIPFMWHFGKGKIMRIYSSSVITKDQKERFDY